MHLVHIHFENAAANGDGGLSFKNSAGEVTKWTLLPPDRSGRELLRLIAAACGGTRLFAHLPFALQQLCRDANQPLQVEYLLALHPPYETTPQGTALWASGVRIDRAGAVGSLKKKEHRLLPAGASIHRAKTGLGNSWLFLLGFGPEPTHHDGTDDFDFTDPFFRISRFQSLFLDGAPLTDPVEFLLRLQYRGVKCKRLAPTHVLERLARLLNECLEMDSGSWLEGGCDFRRAWQALHSWQQRAALPAIDAARHLLCAFQRDMKPLDTPCLVLLDRPDRFCAEAVFPRWVQLMDRLLPQAQFVATVPEQGRQSLPAELPAASHPLPALPGRSHPLSARAPEGTVLLVDVDGRLPNLALMKLSRHFKRHGRSVVLARREAFMPGVEEVHASCVFTRAQTQCLLDRLRRYYGDALVAGGSGVSVSRRLPEEIERLPADYTLYPELGDRAIGFLTRGCPFRCPFCIVPQKEGNPRQVADLDDLLQDGRRKLILLDDNLLAHPKAENLLEQMAARGILVNFNQTLDLRLVDERRARLLKRVHCANLRFTRRVFHFSLNDARNLDEVRRRCGLFGFSSRDNVEFICMYGFDTTLAEDLERFRFLRSLPGAYVFVQEYRPIRGGPPAQLENFFDHRADRLIDELVRIQFSQNMKSMEKYYRWVSKRYAQTFGRPHAGLVDTIFRYNHRQNKGFYLATLDRLHKHALHIE